MKPGIYNFTEIMQGDTSQPVGFALSRTVNDNTTPLDLTGWTLKCTFKHTSGTPVKNLTAEELVITNAAQGEFEIRDLEFDTSGRWLYDIQCTDGDKTHTYLKGSIIVIKDTTV